jgi:glycogen debranching enzyme
MDAAPKDFLQVADLYYVLTTSVLADQDTRVLKQGETFSIFDSYGDVQPVTHSESGVFHRGTRHISRLELCLFGDQRPLLMNSTLRDDNGLLKVDMTNRDMKLPNGNFLGKGTLYIHKEKFLLDSMCLEQVQISNYGAYDVDVDLSYRLGADFADIFEVRGTKRKARGKSEAAVCCDQEITLEYEGLDLIQRKTIFRLEGVNFNFSDDKGDLRAKFSLRIPARGTTKFTMSAFFSQDNLESRERADYEEGLRRIEADHRSGRQRYCGIRSSNEQFDLWMRRSTDDLVMMTTETEEGEFYPYAGIPWFCTAFGRDGIITALECLWANPSLAQGVLSYLAKTQAHERNPERDSTPGKIIHEVREGEMAALKEIPFGRYYGSVDSTPLFLCLGGAYFTRTGDIALVKKLWPAFEEALFWIDNFGDLDGDGFVEYARENPKGLVQQGWKDSYDSIFHAGGNDARGPIALCEVQGYVYMAKLEGAKMALALGHFDLAARLHEQAAELKERFDKAFWLEELGTYAIALDGDKRPCRVNSSNAGQCLFTGIVKKERAVQLARTLMSPEIFCGWGVRTMASSAVRYNPMSYHNGSVWPHDGALIAWGLAKYGFKDEVEKIFCGLFKAAGYMELFRVPEVFCGFERREGEAPTLYPHACSPQSWAAGSVYLMLQALLGIDIDAVKRCVNFSFPRLPECIESLRLTGLTVGDGLVDLTVQNYLSDVSVQLGRRGTGISVTVEK